jgi:hypothetical protein
MDYPQGERAITHHVGPVRVGGSAGSAGWYFVIDRKLLM